MAEKEMIFNVPLRKAKMVPRTRRANYAIKLLRAYISRHMKVPIENVWIDNQVNEAIWKRGIQKPPSKITVKAIKFEEEDTVEVLMPE
ncbi:50S ribosomal protein L31e [Candidatus Aciduliprofundum boonei]|uniref:Large ribosomal subunit protein eL31 n=1 Tax=Aciduliprofundum boonei (strain DSM 19572 / T469) TaxID=439481 RepID=B5IFD4_ACIB4|nr:50S ribosomal protein L31e [Candidatus Aciduliprofundum boonei]ADD07839.1 Ribosomal protein L31e [Aciduliprofundum boonei T469]EDY34515.1 ribosomal protein L31e [Aciduliprofundum boonei T469]EDY34994.1 ribosomal protein L31e [Aciduliprofundum boonei T469]HII54943.1 50S ribosomal protein L31e [Candidatus Aciduliprofundum boonei]